VTEGYSNSIFTATSLGLSSIYNKYRKKNDFQISKKKKKQTKRI